MKTFIAIIIGLASVSGYARLGETETELGERLGRASALSSTSMTHPNFPKGDLKGYKKNGIAVKVEFVDGRCEMISYTDNKPNGRLSEEEMLKLMTSNAKGFKWEKIKPRKLLGNWVNVPKKMWQRSDKKAYAYVAGKYIVFLSAEYLTFVKRELVKQEIAKKKAEQDKKKRTDDF